MSNSNPPTDTPTSAAPLCERCGKTLFPGAIHTCTPSLCPRCGKPWADHDFAVPAPYCP